MLRGPTDAQRGDEEVHRDDRERDRDADHTVDARDERADARCASGGDEHAAPDEVERDVALYGRDRVHGFPSSSRAIASR